LRIEVEDVSERALKGKVSCFLKRQSHEGHVRNTTGRRSW
jgi:hypothetical protein